MRYTADLRVTFEMEPGQSSNLAEIVLRREASQFQHAIERGVGILKTGVKQGPGYSALDQRQRQVQP
jgi:hypothetical protein